MAVVNSPVRSPIRSTVYAPTSGKWDSGVTYSAEATALFARFTTPPTTPRKALIDALIVSLKTAGVWAKLDALYMTAAETSQAARQNWVANQYNLSAANAPSFTADRGYAGDGSSSYLDTNFNPSTASGFFQQDNAHVSAYDATSRAAATVALIGVTGTGNASQTYLIPFYGANLASMIVLTNGVGSTPASTSQGRFLGTRVGASSANSLAYRNGVTMGAFSSTAGQSLPNFTILICGQSQQGTLGFPTSDRIGQASIGAGLSAAEVANFDTAIATYLSAVGA